MSNFNVQITNKGQALLTKALSGKPLVFTRIAIGAGTITNQSIPTMTGLIDRKLWVALNRSRTVIVGEHLVGGSFNNSAIATGFFFRELGLFAQDPDEGEILYSYGNAGNGAEFIPAGGGSSVVEKQVDIISTIGSATNVTATINESLVFPTKAEYEAHRSAEVLDHPDGSVTTDKLANNSVTDDKIGNRTISDTTAPTGNAGKITTLFGWLAHMIKSITGKSSWRTAPPISLETTKTHVDDNSIHTSTSERNVWNAKETTTGAQSKANAAQNAAIATASSDATSKANAVQTNLNAHANDSDIHVTKNKQTAWDAKASTDPATTTTNGLMTKEQVAELANKLDKAVQIPSGSDLNSYTTEGDYYTNSSAIANTILNSPTSGNSFNLKVIKTANSWIVQTATDLLNITHKRRKNGDLGIWSDWVRTPLSDGTLQTGLNSERHNGWRKYSSVEAMGLAATANIQNCLDAMASPSEATLIVNSSNNTVLGLTSSDLGTIKINKLNSGRAQVIFTSDNGRMKQAKISTGNAYSGWNSIGIADGSLQTGFNAERHNGWRDYKSHTELGVAYTASLATIIAAMPDYSTAELYIETANASAVGVNGHGLLRITRWAYSRLNVEFDCVSDNKQYYNPINGNGVLQGWRAIANNDRTLQTDLNADMVDSMHASVDPTANTLVARSPGGWVYGAGLTLNSPDGVNPLVLNSKTMITNLNAERTNGIKTFNSLTTPVGASNGDLWFPPPS